LLKIILDIYSFQNLFFKGRFLLKHIKTFLLTQLDENPYVEFSTGINVNKLPFIVEEITFDDTISFDDVSSVIQGKKLIIPYFSLSSLNKELKKYKCIIKKNMKIAVIEDFEFNLDIFYLLNEIEYTNVYFIADFFDEMEILLPKDRMEGITFNFNKLNQLIFIQFESKKMITFKY
jgi:hypothetical protein